MSTLLAAGWENCNSRARSTAGRNSARADRTIPIPDTIVCVTARAELRQKAKKQTPVIKHTAGRKEIDGVKCNPAATAQKEKTLSYCLNSCTGEWKASSWHLKGGDSSWTYVETRDRRSSAVPHWEQSLEPESCALGAALCQLSAGTATVAPPPRHCPWPWAAVLLGLCMLPGTGQFCPEQILLLAQSQPPPSKNKHTTEQAWNCNTHSLINHITHENILV